MTLILEPRTETDYQLFVELAKRLNVSYREESETPSLSTTAEEQFYNLAGSWQGDLSTDKLIEQIELARTTKNLDFTL